ncbi:MAG: hypothetical protein HRF49_00755 [bacterium]|jgi:hypothetical protein
MTNPSRHTEWLSLVEVSGPFLAVPVLEKAFPQGLDVVETPKRQRLRAAYEEWCDAVENDDSLLADLHREWIRLVFTEILEYDGSTLTTDADMAKAYSVASPERTETFAPDWLVVSPSDGKPRLFVSIQRPGTDLEKVQKDDRWPASLLERMAALCRSHAVRLGVITEGERWMLVNAPVGGTSSAASWYARLWFQEPVTLKAFQSLWSVRRCFGPSDETLEALLDSSLEHQEEITDTLGEQVRRAVEVLVQCLDKADADRNGELLRDVSPAELYEAGLTVMMRLVFVLCAEERGLLLSGDPVYDECYAVSTLRAQLAEEADRHGPEVLDRRHDAWARLLSVFRAVHGGIDHESLRMPALGGSLFDPDRFPFLEGRSKGTSWRDSDADPLPIDNRTVLLLLGSLQSLEQHGGALLLSYRALDVEQIGHVYEGLLEHTVARTPSVTIGLTGSKKAKNPNLPLSELESARMDGEDTLVALVKETTERSESAIRNALARPVDDTVFGRLLAVCGGDTTLAERIRPFANLVRTDAWGDPIVYREGAFMVTLGADRRETGTHYTPKSLTESIVETTLEPVAYIGPAEGVPREEWKLKTPAELLDLKICDPAMGSGAFLVQACRWLAERLVEAWAVEEAAGRFITADGEVRPSAGGADPLPGGLDERLLTARRLIAERCLYGVDVNPLAVELAKLSIWLITLAKGRPFGFLDHNLRHGDSLLGIHRLDQLTKLKLNPDAGPYQQRIFGQNVAGAVAEAVEIRKRLRTVPIRDIRDVETMARLDAEARKKLQSIELVADAMIGEVLRANGNARAIESALDSLAMLAGQYLIGDEKSGKEVSRLAREALSVDLPPGKPPRKPLHWPLEFPEVFVNGKGGFDAIVGNPPFLGNRLWKGALGERMQWQCQMVLGASPGKIDLCVVFHRRAVDLLRPEGCYGMLATSNIAEGSAIEVGLGVIARNGSIFFARKGMPWPGSAAVVVAIVGFFKGEWRADCDADGRRCPRIGPRLEPEAADVWVPQPLPDAPFAFAGVDNSKGLAFVITTSSPWFERLNSEPDSLLRPYVTGDDITSSALNRIERWALDIGDMDLDEIRRRWPIAHRFLVEEVKPTRTAATLKSYKGLIDRWWQFWNHRADLMRRIRQREHFIGYSKNTKYPVGMLAPSGWIYTNKVLLIGIERDDLYAISLSTGFRAWLEKFSGGNLGETLSLSICESVAKYPVPDRAVAQSGIEAANRFNHLAIEFSRQHGCGLTDVMNAIHSPDDHDSTISELRRLLAVIDAEVARAYGWDDLQVAYDFREFEGGSSSDRWRWALSTDVISVLLDRLVTLNRERSPMAKGVRGRRWGRK